MDLQAKELDAQNYNLGRYIAYAFHSPKKYPSKPFLSQNLVRVNTMSGADMESVARSITKKLHGKIQ